MFIFQHTHRLCQCTVCNGLGVFISNKIKYFSLPTKPLFRRILEFITGQKKSVHGYFWTRRRPKQPFDSCSRRRTTVVTEGRKAEYNGNRMVCRWGTGHDIAKVWLSEPHCIEMLANSHWMLTCPTIIFGWCPYAGQHLTPSPPIGAPFVDACVRACVLLARYLTNWQNFIQLWILM